MKINELSMETRPELDRFEPYQPGQSLEEIRRQHGLKRIVKLASNENPLGPSPRGVSAYKKAASQIARYPESKSTALRQVVANKFRVDLSQVLIGAGSDEIIELLAKTFLAPTDEIVISAASFIQYRSAGHLMGARVVVVPMAEMKHDLMAMASIATGKSKLLFIANPNNPTGTYNTKPEVEAFLSALPGHVLPVFDEAYFEYASVQDNYPSMIDAYFRKRPMVVLRTFSKLFGLAGLRVGYGVAPESVVAAMDRIRPPFNVSVPAQAAAEAAIFDTEHVAKSVKMNEQQKIFLMKALENLGRPVVPSATNFLLFQVRPFSGRTVFRRLLQKGVITRPVDEYGLPDYLRVTVGKPDENRFFIRALTEVLGKK